MTPYDRASRVQTALEAALGPGGEFDLALDELIVKAQILALDTAGVSISDDGPPKGWDDDHIRERVAWPGQYPVSIVDDCIAAIHETIVNRVEELGVAR